MYGVVLVGTALVVGLAIMGIAYVVVTRAGKNGGDDFRGNDGGEK
jgi:multisubunit Na+/H+ antiporter MnhC subunit